MSIMRSAAIVGLIVCGLLSTPIVISSQSNALSLDTTVVKHLMSFRSIWPNGLVIFQFIDAETQREIDSVEVLWKGEGNSYINRKWPQPSSWIPSWRTPGYYSCKFVMSGYLTVVVDSIRVPIDSAIIVTIQLKKRNGTIESRLPGDSHVHVITATLDGTFPKNQIVGAIVDDSSGLPISGVTVLCEETDVTVSTDSLGEFVIGLNLLKSVTLNAWHPLFDSISFEVSKGFIRTTKKVEIHFQAQRRDMYGEKIRHHVDSTLLLLVDMKPWAKGELTLLSVTEWPSLKKYPLEFLHRVYTYAILQGEEFGPTSRWETYNFDGRPFRLIRELPDETALVEFSSCFRSITENWNGTANIVVISVSAVKLGTLSKDAGTTYSLRILPDYSPSGIMKK